MHQRLCITIQKHRGRVLLFNDTAITKMISVALLILPGLGLSLSECKQFIEGEMAGG